MNALRMFPRFLPRAHVRSPSELRSPTPAHDPSYPQLPYTEIEAGCYRHLDSPCRSWKVWTFVLSFIAVLFRVALIILWIVDGPEFEVDCNAAEKTTMC